MTQTRANVDVFLQDKYDPVLENTFNDSTIVLSQFERGKAKVTPDGRRVLVAIETNDTVGITNSDAGVLPASGSLQGVTLDVRLHRMLARFALDGELLDINKSGKGSWIRPLQRQMESLVTRVRDRADQMTIFGGACCGFINEHKVAPVGTPGAAAGQDLANPLATTEQVTWEYSGDYTVFNGNRDKAGAAVAQGTASTWIRIRLVRMDTYADIPILTAAGGATVNPNFWVSDFSVQNQTIEITSGTDTVPAGDIYTTLNVTAGYATAVLLHTVQAVESPGNGGANWGTLHDFSNDQNGIFDNLANPTHFTVDRTDATATNNATSIRSNVMTMNATGNHARVAFNMARWTRVYDLVEHGDTSSPIVREGAGARPDLRITNPLSRSVYVAALTTTPQFDYGGGRKGAGVGDMGFTELMIDGAQFLISRHVPQSMWILAKRSSWNWYQLGSKKFANEDGNVLSRVSGQDQFEGYYRWIWNLACRRPDCNAILIGQNLV